MILEAPALLDGLEPYYEAFAELSTCRDVALGTGPIPWTAIDQYAMRYGYEGEEFEYLERLVRALDDAFLKYQADKKDKPGGKPK